MSNEFGNGLVDQQTALAIAFNAGNLCFADIILDELVEMDMPGTQTTLLVDIIEQMKQILLDETEDLAAGAAEMLTGIAESL